MQIHSVYRDQNSSVKTIKKFSLVLAPLAFTPALSLISFSNNSAPTQLNKNLSAVSTDAAQRFLDSAPSGLDRAYPVVTHTTPEFELENLYYLTPNNFRGAKSLKLIYQTIEDEAKARRNEGQPISRAGESSHFSVQTETVLNSTENQLKATITGWENIKNIASLGFEQIGKKIHENDNTLYDETQRHYLTKHTIEGPYTTSGYKWVLDNTKPKPSTYYPSPSTNSQSWTWKKVVTIHDDPKFPLEYEYISTYDPTSGPYPVTGKYITTKVKKPQTRRNRFTEKEIGSLDALRSPNDDRRTWADFQDLIKYWNNNTETAYNTYLSWRRNSEAGPVDNELRPLKEISNLKITSVDLDLKYNKENTSASTLKVKIKSQLEYKAMATMTNDHKALLNLEELLPKVFVFNRATSHAVSYENIYLDGTNPPKLRLGLNNELFKAVEWRKWWIDDPIGRIVRATGNISMQYTLVRYILEKKVGPDNWNKVVEHVLNGEIFELKPLSFAKYFNDEYKIGNENIVDYLSEKINLGSIKDSSANVPQQMTNNVTYTRAELLANYIKQSWFVLTYHGDGENNYIDLTKSLLDTSLPFRNKYPIQNPMSKISHVKIWHAMGENLFSKPGYFGETPLHSITPLNDWEEGETTYPYNAATKTYELFYSAGTDIPVYDI